MMKRDVKKKLFLGLSMLFFINSYSFEISIEGLDSLGLSDEVSAEESINNSETKSDFNFNFEKENLTFYGDFTDDLEFQNFDKESMNYKLKDSKGLIKENTYQNSLGLNLNSSYKYEMFEMQIKTYSQYINDDNSQFNFYEAYVTYSPNYNFYMQTGKSALYWGKGYAFNPVGVINPVKDPDDPETSGEGRNLINMEYTKSYNDKLADVFTGNLVFIFDNDDTENGLGDTSNIQTAIKTYFLVFNSDVDFIYYSKNDLNKIGFDFSTNILPELEFHGEYIYEEDSEKRQIDTSGNLTTDIKDTSSYLVGLKYLFATGTNVILEYYYNGKGMDEESYNNLYDNYELNYSKAYTTYKQLGKNPMEKYIYTKISHPEPFNLTYTSISLSNIANVIDRSSSTKLNFTYTPYNNVKLYTETAYVGGSKSSEFGDKKNINFKLGGTLSF